MATTIWRQIAETLRDEIAAGRYPPGGRLPTEAALSTRFGVNRHTVRRALADLGAAGLVRSRRGAGVFVSSRPIAYRLGQRTRFSQNIAEAGGQVERQILRLETLASTAEEAERLGLSAGAPVHVMEGIGSVGGGPLSYSHSVFPAAGLEALPEALRRDGSVTAALAACGVADYRRARTAITAERAEGTVALHLRLANGAPVLRTDGLNTDLSGRAIEFGRTWFPADRIELVVDASSFM